MEGAYVVFTLSFNPFVFPPVLSSVTCGFLCRVSNELILLFFAFINHKNILVLIRGPYACPLNMFFMEK